MGTCGKLVKLPALKTPNQSKKRTQLSKEKLNMHLLQEVQITFSGSQYPQKHQYVEMRAEGVCTTCSAHCTRVKPLA